MSKCSPHDLPGEYETTNVVHATKDTHVRWANTHRYWYSWRKIFVTGSSGEEGFRGVVWGNVGGEGVGDDQRHQYGVPQWLVSILYRSDEE